VGGVAFGIDLGLLLLLAPLLPLLLANTIAFLVANAANFLIGHLWVFRGAGRDSGILAKYGAVLLISLVGVALNDALVWIGVVLLQAGVVTSKIAATLAVWGWNYWTRASWVYGRS
jgi:putative flippase GtrA